MMMKGFISKFLAISAMYTACFALAFPLAWLIKWQPPSLDDVLRWENFRILSSLWLLSVVGAWWLNRD